MRGGASGAGGDRDRDTRGGDRDRDIRGGGGGRQEEEEEEEEQEELLGRMVEVLLRGVEEPVRKVEGVGEGFLDGEFFFWRGVFWGGRIKECGVGCKKESKTRGGKNPNSVSFNQ